MAVVESFSSLECFIRSAEVGSFAEAARRLSLTPAAVGKNVAQLEARLGVRLFLRSTRKLTLTEAGQRFLAEVSESFRTIQYAVSNLANCEGHPSGVLRVSMGTVFGRLYVLPLLGEFLARYPAVTADWHFDNRQVDLIGQGFDAAIGGGFELPPGVVARKLTPAHRVLVASPDYLRQQGPLSRPEQLQTCAGILIRSPQTGRVRSWPLTSRWQEQQPLQLPQRLTMSDSDAACVVAEQGLGIALVSLPFALPYLTAGRLSRVLPDWYVDDGHISLYYAERKLLPGKTRAFIDFVVEQFAEQGLAGRFDALQGH
ncbi:LysR family transcriptional regulator [Pseudomonas carassii]|uniref:LysR family transcriptional regulator n=1 Tax=Pseudomonas carassii TaxID=3115855 RepID=A0ABU7HBU1_9PSED|nr:LysR family transcriptional regulator [Pseudomonas sp. 137P]MEE1888789.1 LysR family transcriptional regulator [Pseudomonas sp. 137P]